MRLFASLFFSGVVVLLLLVFLKTPNISSVTLDCQMPSTHKMPHKTFVVNENLSCATNIFLNVAPVISAETEKKLSPEEKHNPQAAGRLAYVHFGEAFAKQKPSVPIKDFKIKGKDGNHEISLRFYEGQDKKKVILFIHGGGWSRGNLETHDTLCRKLNEATKASVFAVDYRLAPENPYPAGLNDAEDAYNYLLQDYGKDSKIFIAGDSGGGNIASCLALKLIKEEKRVPEGAILFYPALDLRIPEKTTNPYANGYLLTRDNINIYIHNYIGDAYDKANDPLVSPLLASDKDLKKFPKTILINAECDPLTAEGKTFAERLKSLGVSVDHKVIPHTIHIFAQYFDLFPEAQESIDFVKQAFEKL